jgi:GTPase SAR1 family protein
MADHILRSLVSQLDELIGIATEINSDIVTDMQQTREHLVSLKHRVVVLGRFSTGKSTLLNAFLGMDILPSGNIPVSRRVVELSSSETPHAAIVHPDGTEKTVPLDKIRDYGKKVGVRIRVGLNHTFLSKSVVFVDTPGLEGVEDGITRITMGEIPFADTCLMVFDLAEGAVSARERDFLEDHVLKEDRNRRMILVLNKIDAAADAKDVQEGVNYLTTALGALVLNPKVFPVSAAMALKGRMLGDLEAVNKSGIQALERELDAVLKRGLYSEMQSRARRLMAPLCASLLQSIDGRIDAMALEESRRHERKSELEAQLNNVPAILSAQESEFRGRVRKLQGEFEDRLSGFIENLHMRVEQKVYSPETGLEQLRDPWTIESSIAAAVKDFLAQVAGEYEGKANEALVKLSSRLQERMRSKGIVIPAECVPDPVLLRSPGIATIGALIVAWPVMGLISWVATAFAVTFCRSEIEKWIKDVVGQNALPAARRSVMEAVQKYLAGVKKSLLAEFDERFTRVAEKEIDSLRHTVELTTTSVRAELQQLTGVNADVPLDRLRELKARAQAVCDELNSLPSGGNHV